MQTTPTHHHITAAEHLTDAEQLTNSAPNDATGTSHDGDTTAPIVLRDPASRVRWWIAFALTAVVVAAVLVPLISIVRTREHNAVSIADELVVRIGERTSDLVTGELTTAAQSLELLALLIETADDDASIERALAAELSSVSQLSGAFVGFPDGSFQFVRRDGDELTLKRITADGTVTEATVDDDLSQGPPVRIESDGYDARTRPWYRAAVDADGPVWTDPYVFFTSGRPGVTAAVAVRADDGGVSAVVGVDVELAQMASFLADLPIDDSAEAFILTDEAIVVAPATYDLELAERDGGVQLAAASQVGLDADSLMTALEQSRPVDVGGGDRLFALTVDDPELPSWIVAVRTGDIEFVGVVGRQSQIALISTIVAALALLAVIPLVVVRLRRPIDELSRRARFDPLTGLPNRDTLFEAGQDEIRRAYKSGEEVTLAVLDLDDFKSINDRFGHASGDQAIQAVADALRTSVRSTDLVARLGGDEFVIVMRGPDRETSLSILDGVHAAVQDRLGRVDEARGTGVTLGATWLETRALHIRRLIAEADHALIEAKRHAKGTVAPR